MVHCLPQKYPGKNIHTFQPNGLNLERIQHNHCRKPQNANNSKNQRHQRVATQLLCRFFQLQIEVVSYCVRIDDFFLFVYAVAVYLQLQCAVRLVRFGTRLQKLRHFRRYYRCFRGRIGGKKTVVVGYRHVYYTWQICFVHCSFSVSCHTTAMCTKVTLK